MTSSFSTDRSAELHARSCQSLAMGVSSGMRRSVPPVPMFFERGDGPYFHDVDGHRLLDYTLGWGPLILGNNHPAINQAVQRQLSSAYGYGAQHVGEIELAELLVQAVPGVERVIFSNTGTEAVQAAIRIARTHTGRSKVVKFEGHYHGWLNNVLVSYRLDENDPCEAKSACGGQPLAEFSETIVLPWNDPAALKEAFAANSDEIACVITEPLLANGGGCLPDEGYLQQIVDLSQKHGAISIFDEVITGFRIALGGARERFAIQPDLSVYGKALAAGFSLSAVGGRAELFEVLEQGQTIHAGTYNGSPINVAAAIAAVTALSEPSVYSGIDQHGMAIREAIHSAAEKHGVQLATAGLGAVFSVHFGLTDPPRDYRETLRANSDQLAAFRMAMLQHGVLLLPDGRWYVGGTHGSAELESTRTAIAHAMAALPN